MNYRKKHQYLLQKEKENNLKTIEHNKQLLKEHITTNKPLPHSIKKDAVNLLDEILFDIDHKEISELVPIIITSRNPSDSLKRFAKRLGCIFSTNVLPRGNLTRSDIARYMEKSDYNLVIKVGENRGTPCNIVFSEYPYGPSYHFTITNVKMGDFRINGKANFMADGIENEQESKFKDFFCRMFIEGTRTVLIAKREGSLCFRHYMGDEAEGFDMKMYEIVNGTLDGGEKEWVYKPYANSAINKE